MSSNDSMPIRIEAATKQEREDAAREGAKVETMRAAPEPPRVDPMAELLIRPGGAWHKHKWPRRKVRPMVGRYG